MKQNIVLGLAALALGFAAIKTVTPVLAYRGDPTVTGPNYTEERHETNLSAFENADYQSWLANMQGRGVTRFVNESNFREFATAQLAAQKGDSSLLTAFRAKYNMGQGLGQGRSMGLHANQ